MIPYDELASRLERYLARKNQPIGEAQSGDSGSLYSGPIDYADEATAIGAPDEASPEDFDVVADESTEGGRNGTNLPN